MKPKLNLRLAAGKQPWPQYSVQFGREAQLELLVVMRLKNFDIVHSVYSNLIHIFYYKTNKCTPNRYSLIIYINPPAYFDAIAQSSGS